MSEVIVRMKMPTGCANCPMGDDDSRFCKAAKEYIPMLSRPSWCPIKGEVEYARMVHERIMDEIKDNVSMKRLEEELFVLCKEKEDADS